jgi:uncharacterized protein YjbJ (UPF0337 family)
VPSGLARALIIAIVLPVFGRIWVDTRIFRHHGAMEESGQLFVGCGRVARPDQSIDRQLAVRHPHLVTNGDVIMDKDRIQGSLKQVVGRIKEAVGKAAGDEKTEADGKAEKAAGKLQNAVGSMKDAAREKFGR